MYCSFLDAHSHQARDSITHSQQPLTVKEHQSLQQALLKETDLCHQASTEQAHQRKISNISIQITFVH